MTQITVAIGDGSLLSWTLTGNVDDAKRIIDDYNAMRDAPGDPNAGQALFATLDRLAERLHKTGVKIAEVTTK